MVAKLTEPPPEGNQPSVSQMPHPLASNQSDRPADQEAWAEPQDASSKAASGQPLATSETYLWNTSQVSPADGSSTKGFVEEQSGQPPGLKITRHTDWEANPVEDNKLTYSAPGSSVKFTVREANSSGFAGSAFTPGFGMQGDENSGAFGLTPVPWGATAMARSQKVDWTLVNLKNFGVTAFGYQNEVGSNFKAFGQTKNEFADSWQQHHESRRCGSGRTIWFRLRTVQPRATCVVWFPGRRDWRKLSRGTAGGLGYS